MELREILPGVKRWALRHPEWTPEDAADGGREAVVASYLLDAAAPVLIDPLAPPEGSPDRELFWQTLDRELDSRPPAVLITLFWHARSSQEVLDRYAGARVWAHQPAAELVGERVRHTDTFRVGEALPGGVEAIDAGRAFEVLFFLPRQHALIAGDVLLGAEGGGLRMLPESWLGGRDYEHFRSELRERLLEVPVEHVLLTHGDAVLGHGGKALAMALGA